MSGYGDIWRSNKLFERFQTAFSSTLISNILHVKCNGQNFTQINFPSYLEHLYQVNVIISVCDIIQC